MAAARATTINRTPLDGDRAPSRRGHSLSVSTLDCWSCAAASWKPNPATKLLPEPLQHRPSQGGVHLAWPLAFCQEGVDTRRWSARYTTAGRLQPAAVSRSFSVKLLQPA